MDAILARVRTADGRFDLSVLQHLKCACSVFLKVHPLARSVLLTHASRTSADWSLTKDLIPRGSFYSATPPLFTCLEVRWRRV